MPYCCVRPKGDDQGEAYWVSATSDDEARRLVALNVGHAQDADHPGKFECEANAAKQPPFGLIYRRLNGPLTIEKR